MVCVICNAQEAGSWPAIEKFVRAQKPVENSADLKQFTSSVIHRYQDTLSRIKAIYVWLTENIMYDENDNRGKNIKIDSALKYKAAICAGYTNLFILLCDEIGVQAKEISGYATGNMYGVMTDEKFKINHAWTAVWLNGKWNLIDPTWASGYTLDGEKKFIKQRNDWYFFAAPERFSRDHYPKDASWQLLKDTVSWDAFKRLPVFSLGAQEDSITAYLPGQYIIQSRVGDSILFSFTTKKHLSRILVKSKTRTISLVDYLDRKADTYSYHFRVPFEGVYDLSITLFDLPSEKINHDQTFEFKVDFVYQVNASGNKQTNKM